MIPRRHHPRRGKCIWRWLRSERTTRYGDRERTVSIYERSGFYIDNHTRCFACIHAPRKGETNPLHHQRRVAALIQPVNVCEQFFVVIGFLAKTKDCVVLQKILIVIAPVVPGYNTIAADVVQHVPDSRFLCFVPVKADACNVRVLSFFPRVLRVG